MGCNSPSSQIEFHPEIQEDAICVIRKVNTGIQALEPTRCPDTSARLPESRQHFCSSTKIIGASPRR
ncbi:Protein of unknown function [Pyronema omphalodes CBS 100304]|uniref:Uncharacterized protein n=1 Tax=Pyronema omphalodes (strain CBS 100304) TaxID=1076935 RepID=U4L5I8_PYROM|nr:Protein of unknown function [Pyronema omphalodes CBS 100304]